MVVCMLNIWHPFNKSQDMVNVASKYATFPEFIMIDGYVYKVEFFTN